VKPLSGLNHLDLDNARLATPNAFDRVNLKAAVADEPRVNELCHVLLLNGDKYRPCLTRKCDVPVTTKGIGRRSVEAIQLRYAKDSSESFFH
jgi:hypothetical protein